MHKYIAEFIGTFTLASVVILTVVKGGALDTPVAAGLVLALFVYTIGVISGCHINPAVTLGALSIKKISVQDAIGYIVAQLVGGILAALTLKGLFGIVMPVMPVATMTSALFLAEALGAFLFGFGIAAVVYGKVSGEHGGLVIGGSLLLGVTVAATAGDAGILNPAVALALGAFNVLYVLAPIVGVAIGMQAYRMLIGHKLNA